MLREEAIKELQEAHDIMRSYDLDDSESRLMTALIMAIQALEQEIPIKCEDCKHFRKLPFHKGVIGKCIQHTGFCPKGDWYCADAENEVSR